MSAGINKAAIIGGADFDEETWLVEPPSLPARSDTEQNSGRIIEWLQGATMNVDFQTRSALSRKLASQAAKKKKRAEKLREKAAANGHSPSHLARVQEELAEFYLSNGDEVVTPELNGFYSADHANNAKKLGKHLEVVHENEQQPGAAETVSPRGTTATMTSDDENDEFYDASSEFNDSPRNLTLTTAANETREKLVLNGSPLSAVNECAEIPADVKTNGLSSANGLRDETRFSRQANTARVPPTVIQNAAERSPRLEKSSPLSSSAKSHSPSSQPDLNDIRSIVERQETELREELSRRKSCAQIENDKAASLRTRVSSQTQCTRPGTSLASSRSVEFGANGAKLSPLATSSPISHMSRLPTPVRKNVGRSMIPTPRTCLLSRSAVRGLAGGSTPSLVVPSQHTSDETRSECGGILHNEQRWADECF